MSDEDVTRMSFEQPPRKSEQRAAAAAERGEEPRKPRTKGQIPRLPRRDVDPEKIAKPDQRAVACVNMKLAGASFVDIANELGYAGPQAAEQAYVNALAGMYPVETWESLRQIEAMRAEQLFSQSFAMASADYLVVDDADGNEVQVPNTERLKWHEQAAKDLMMHAAITGAKAPARVEVSASTQELNQMVEIILHNSGAERAIEASVFDLADIPDDGIEDAEVVED